MHKEVASGRPGETTCGQRKVLQHWQIKKYIYKNTEMMSTVSTVDRQFQVNTVQVEKGNKHAREVGKTALA